MHKIIGALVIATLGCLALPSIAAASACEPGQVAQRYPSLAGKTIQMGADPQTPPYASVDPKDPDRLTGSDIDLAKAVFDCLGLKYEIKPAAWSGLFPAVVSGQIDLMYYLYYNPERVKQGDFIVYMAAGTGAITQKGNPKHIKSVNDLCGKSVATGLGSVEEAQMQDLSKACVAKGAQPVEIATYSEHSAGFRLVAGNRADIMLTDLALVDKTAADNPTVYERAFAIMSGMQIGVAVKKGNTALSGAILDGLSAVQAAGTEKKIFAKYGIDPSLQLPATLKTD
ncbi:amino acid ABC transporter substrate-binding protein, PAAT family [Burkholderia sp. D7]|nr:amino acid ABC transporter substrate-binding protein, PAAT family [Burkholderia sp. D7]